MNDTQKILWKARELLDDSERWCQRALETRTGKYCLVGAITRAGRDLQLRHCVHDAVLCCQHLVKSMNLFGVDIMAWNDHRDRKHHEVIHLLKEAEILAGQED